MFFLPNHFTSKPKAVSVPAFCSAVVVGLLAGGPGIGHAETHLDRASQTRMGVSAYISETCVVSGALTGGHATCAYGTPYTVTNPTPANRSHSQSVTSTDADGRVTVTF